MNGTTANVEKTFLNRRSVLVNIQARIYPTMVVKIVMVVAISRVFHKGARNRTPDTTDVSALSKYFRVRVPACWLKYFASMEWTVTDSERSMKTGTAIR
ncbi:hypothetical protein [Sphaerochaeta sp. PS]|uniref:hypothetical protein n=1 Tax=Sphaerochaeta sp. PS TaxID=3076336 RepID=UPI0028A3D814|nr:hypothetical protein [Sphaerochaeta sp. PS]MDT4763182.1 hypothetical protein [Sphaerochaeta sp. PS]